MKVDGPGKSAPAKGVSKTGAKKGAGDASFSGMIGENEAAEAQKPVSGVMAIGQLDALLSLQEAGDGTSEEATKKARKRGVMLLEGLEKVRIGLLTGEIPQSTLRELGNMVSVHREQITDPRLAEIIDEIDLRVQVELAKLGR